MINKQVADAGWKPWIAAFILFPVMANIIFWLLAYKLYLIRGVFVLEYFILAMLYPYLSRKIFIVCWIVLSLYDLLYSTTNMLFMGFVDMYKAALEVQHITLARFSLWIALVILVILVFWGVARLLVYSHNKTGFLHPRYMIAVSLVFLLLDFFNGGNTLSGQYRDTRYIAANIISCPGGSLCRNIYNSIGKAKEKYKYQPFPSVAKKVFRDSVAGQPKEMLILVESWGILRDTALRDFIMQPIRQLEGDYTIEVGKTQYKYLTQAAELRELTGFLVNENDITTSFADRNSLLQQKIKSGYAVLGVHGYSSGFYNRQRWWPVLGMQQMYFAPELKKMGISSCGKDLFIGACDTAIGHWLFSRMQLEPSKKEFYYWLTLNTHLPLIDNESNEYRDFAALWLAKGLHAKIVQMAYQHYCLYRNLAAEIKKLSSCRPHILIVGDHAPPFLERSIREYYEPGVVNYINITPANAY